MFETISEVPPGTTSQKKRWLIQSKFETPVLNFANVPLGDPTIASTVASSQTSSASEIITRGMWHQYGSPITSSTAGCFTNISDDGSNSLADIVGFNKGIPQRVGAIKTELLLEEAIIAIPYKPSKNRRNFIKFTNKTKQSNTYQKLTAAMSKYIFPPRFDFMQFNTVDPILMYVFEFNAKLSQQDLADIWQNLPPNINEKFESKEAVVEEEELLGLILDKDSNTHWMVFKVKKRATANFEKYRKQLVSSDLTALPPVTTGPMIISLWSN